MFESFFPLFSLAKTAIEAVGFEAADLPLSVVFPLLATSLFPVLHRKDLAIPTETNDLFSAFMDHMPGFAWIKDADGRYVYANERVKQLKLIKSITVGERDADSWSPAVAAKFRESDRVVFETGRSVETVESLVIEGEERWALVTRFPILDESGAVILVGGTSVDITAHKRSKEALRQSESFRRMIVESEPECVKLVAPDGTLLDMNPAGLAMVEATSRDQVIGRPVVSLIAPEWRDRFLGMHERICRGETVVSEFEIIGLNGSRRWIESHGVPLRDNDSKIIAQLAIARDITERRRAAEAQRNAEQKYRDIFENANDGIFQSTPEGKLLSANPALARMFGYESSSDMVDESCLDVSQQLYVESSRREDFRQLMEKDGLVRDFEYRAVRKDGRKIWISLDARTVLDDRGGISYYEGIAQDITERQQAQDELRTQKEILEKIFDHLPVMITFTDRAGRTKLVNQEWEHTLGWSQEEIRAGDLDILAECYPDPHYRSKVMQFLKVANGEWHDFKTRTRDGNTIDTTWARVQLSDGTTIGIGKDISERKRTEQALQQAEQRYRELFENAKDATYVHDLNGRYTSLNRAAEKLSGYSRDEIIGRNFGDFVAPEFLKEMRENICKKLRKEGETTYEVEVITKDGRRVPVEVSSCLIFDEGVPVGVQGTARNIEERRRAEEALRSYARQLILAQETERQIIARELHDQVGQMLTAIRINLETIRVSRDIAETTTLINEGVAVVDQAIQQVRELSFTLRPSLLDDLGLTSALRWYVDRYAQRTGISARTSVSPESQSRFTREIETACFRIAQEALTNVARHARAESVCVDVRTTNGEVAIMIKDDGIGFDPHSLAKSVALNRLGLRGMEERAHLLGGKLEIKSAPNKGTEVRAHFPNVNKKDLN